MSIERKFQLALDETRLLMLASQILFGFEFQSVFQDGFATWPQASRRADALGLMLMVATIAFLLAPTSLHRLAERGQITGRLRSALTRFTEAALLPFAMSLGIDLYVVLGSAFGPETGIAVGAGFFALALLGWYVVEFVYREAVLKKKRNVANKRGDMPTPLDSRIDQMLTEARIALPGAQALLGFQLAVILTKAFDALPLQIRIVHAVALLAVAVSLILLVAPAAFHRIAFDGDDTERFFRIGSNLVSAALLPLLIGIAGDVYVAIGRILNSESFGVMAGFASFVLLFGLWYVFPLTLRWTAPKIPAK
jgi:Family of unknown function (DUF6328)